MTIKLIDGCDLYSTTITDLFRRGYTTGGNGGGLAVVTNGGRYGQGMIRLTQSNTGNETLDISYGAAFTTATVAVALNFGVTVSGGSPTDRPLFQLRGGNADAITVLYNYSTGNIEIRRGGVAGTSLQTISTTITNGTWYHWEFKVVISTTVGTLDLYKDGVSIHTSTGQNTGSISIDQCRFNAPGGTNRRSVDIDDIVLTDGDLFGNSRIHTLSPSSDTAEKDFSRSTGADNFALVDEKPPTDDTDYVFGSTSGDYDLYGMGNLPVVPANLYAVQVSLVTRKVEAGGRSIRTKLKSGASTYDGTYASLNLTYTIHSTLYRLNPNGNVTWTNAAVNAASAGMELST